MADLLPTSVVESYSRELAFARLEALVGGARIVRAELSGGPASA